MNMASLMDSSRNACAYPALRKSCERAVVCVARYDRTPITKEHFESLACEPIYGFQGPGAPEHIVLDGQQRLTAGSL